MPQSRRGCGIIMGNAGGTFGHSCQECFTISLVQWRNSESTGPCLIRNNANTRDKSSLRGYSNKPRSTLMAGEISNRDRLRKWRGNYQASVRSR